MKVHMEEVPEQAQPSSSTPVSKFSDGRKQLEALTKAQKLQAQINKDMQNNEVFRRACSLANTPVTKRQASKYSRKRGIAYRYIHQARNELQLEELNRRNEALGA